MGRQLERHTNKNHHFGLQAFLIALVTACVLIIPFIIFDGGVFYYYGDFNVQEIPLCIFLPLSLLLQRKP